MFDDEMLTIEDLAAYLKLKPQTIYKWAQSGKIPGAKFGKEWRFRRSAIEKWIDSQIPAFVGPNAGQGASLGSGKEARLSTSERREPGPVGGMTRPVTEAEPAQRSPQACGAPVHGTVGHGTVAHGALLHGKGGHEAGVEGDGLGELSVKGSGASRAGALKGDGAVVDALGLDTSERGGVERSQGLPVEKLAGARKGSRPGRKDRGPESN